MGLDFKIVTVDELFDIMQEFIDSPNQEKAFDGFHEISDEAFTTLSDEYMSDDETPRLFPFDEVTAELTVPLLDEVGAIRGRQAVKDLEEFLEERFELLNYNLEVVPEKLSKLRTRSYEQQGLITRTFKNENYTETIVQAILALSYTEALFYRLARLTKEAADGE